MTVTLNQNKLGELDALTISGASFHAVVLLQGAQLIHFMATDTDKDASELSDNWLWVGDHAVYQQGTAVRGGVPLCWPIFGQYDANPSSVQHSFKDCPLAKQQHGYARLQDFELDSFEASCLGVHKAIDSSVLNDHPCSQLVLKLKSPISLPSFNNNPIYPACHLDLKVRFEFSSHGFDITLITQNNSDKTICFSQALHTYLPTHDITQTKITGFDGINYSDTLTTSPTSGQWQTKTQQGDIIFESEVDRIYHGAPDINLNTPTHSYKLQAKGSNSTVIWNPWQDKAKIISQMNTDDFKNMICIETANAHLDVVELAPSQMYSLTMCMQRHTLLK